MGRIAVLAAILLVGAPALAQPVTEDVKLFEEGRELAKQGKWAEACKKFEASLAIDRAAPGTKLNYGDCLEQLGQLRKAWRMYDEAAQAFEKSKDERAKFARNRASAVLPKLGTLVIRIVHPDASGLVVEIGGQAVAPSAEITERWEPGDVEVSARVPGHKPYTTTARVTAGARVNLEIPAFDTAVAPEPEGPVTQPGRRARGRVYTALGIGAGGGLLLLGSGIIGLTARSLYRDADCMDVMGKRICTEAGAKQSEDAGTRADLATYVGIAGGVFVVTGVVLYLTAPRESLTVTPTASATGAGLSISGRF